MASPSNRNQGDDAGPGLQSDANFPVDVNNHSAAPLHSEVQRVADYDEIVRQRPDFPLPYSVLNGGLQAFANGQHEFFRPARYRVHLNAKEKSPEELLPIFEALGISPSQASTALRAQSKLPLCTRCKQLLRRGWKPGYQIEIVHHGYDAQVIAASKGCQLCALFVSAIPWPPNSESFDLYIKASTYSKCRFVNNKKLSGIEVEFQSQTLNKPAVYVALHKERAEHASGILAPRYQPWEDAINADWSEGSTGDLSSIAFGHEMLRRCIAEHPLCRSRHPANGTLPTRLLDLTDFLLKRRVYVRESNSIPVTSQYTTLSHIWGSHAPVKLEKATIHGFMKNGVDALTLPKTFYEAIRVTVQLGFNFIWIDSLCIRQDSEADWYTESRQMQNVYSEGVCNIAASCSVDATGGLFRPRSASLRAPFHIKIAAADRNDIIEDVYIPFHHQMWDHEIIRAPLNSRAWVFQERILSTRILHFGTKRLTWECRELCATEGFPAGIPQQVAAGRLEKKKEFYSLLDRLESCRVALGGESSFDVDHEALLLQLFRTWSSMVMDYTKLRLSRKTDRLVAISGIAHTIYDSLPSIDRLYISGIFRTNFLLELLWATHDPRKRSVEGDTPSWSWGSVEAPIFYLVLGDSIWKPINLETARPLVSITHDKQVGFNTKRDKTAGHALRAHGIMLQVTVREETLMYDIGKGKVPFTAPALEYSGTFQGLGVLLDEQSDRTALHASSRSDVFWMPFITGQAK